VWQPPEAVNGLGHAPFVEEKIGLGFNLNVEFGGVGNAHLVGILQSAM
jgi:hypothetical protein